MSDKDDGLMESIKHFTGFGDLLFHKSSAIGVDVGSRSVKVVILEQKKGKLILKNYTIAKTKEDLIKAGTSGVITSMAGNMIKKVAQQAEIREEKVNVSVPSFSSLITTIEIPKMPQDEIEQVVQIEAPKYIPVQLSDVVYGWQIVDDGSLPGDDKKKRETSANPRGIKVMVVAIMREISGQYEKVFQESGHAIDSLEIDSFSLTRSLARDDEECKVILDIGHKVTNILITSKGNILVNRTIDVAGERITKAIARGMNIDEDRAEQYKLENGVSMGAGQDGGVIAQMLDVLVNEVTQTIEVFRKDYSHLEPKSIILSGGGAYMKGLEEYIEKEAKIKTKVGNPLTGIVFPEKYKNSVLSNAPLLSVAIGLAKLPFDDKNKLQ
ncbi:MAG: type IV pilus assembly protein PilM [Patescibacteria group bacterium]|nr:type IV pilus assembly protein PilM [Patescibacteria group bacterium]